MLSFVLLRAITYLSWNAVPVRTLLGAFSIQWRTGRGSRTDSTYRKSFPVRIYRDGWATTGINPFLIILHLLRAMQHCRITCDASSPTPTCAFTKVPILCFTAKSIIIMSPSTHPTQSSHQFNLNVINMTGYYIYMPLSNKLILLLLLKYTIKLIINYFNIY